MKQIISYLKNPTYIRIHKFEFKEFVKAFFLVFFVNFLMGGFVIILRSLFSIEEMELNINKIAIFLLSVVAAPIIEEVISRLYLRPTKLNIRIYLGVIIFLIVWLSIKEHIYFLCILPFLFGISVLIYKKTKTKHLKVYRWYLKHFKVIFYLSSLIFGLVHISNYQIPNCTMYLILPLIVAPQIFAGCVLGFIRMKYGIIFSILLHSCFNLLAFSLLLWS